MLLKTKSTSHMVEVTSLIDLMNLNLSQVMGRYQEGEEQQDPVMLDKGDLVFLSGEDLPRCWTDPHYRDEEIRHQFTVHG